MGKIQYIFCVSSLHWNEWLTFRQLNADERKMFQRSSLFTLSCFCAQCAAVTMTSTVFFFFFFLFCGESSSQCACQAVSFPVSSSLLLKRWWVVKMSYLFKKISSASQKNTFSTFMLHRSTEKPSRWRCLKKPWTKREKKKLKKSVSDSWSLRVNVASPCRTSFWPFNVKDIVGEVKTCYCVTVKDHMSFSFWFHCFTPFGIHKTHH